MLNRLQAPLFNTINSIEVQEAKFQHLENGIPVYTVNGGSQELVRIDFIFPAGACFQNKAMVSNYTLQMMENGTTHHTEEEISENLDFYGSYYSTRSDHEHTYISLFSLNKHLKNSLYYVADIIKNASFPEKEFKLLMTNSKQDYIIDSQKVAVLARRRFFELLYGRMNPFGQIAKEEDFDLLKREELIDFYKKHYLLAECTIIVAGKLPIDLLEILNEKFGKEKINNAKALQLPELKIQSDKVREHRIDKSDAIQNSIRIGRLIFDEKHPDYFKFTVLNTLLGGYFGSRLMSNIREDKGYTYGIGSGLFMNNYTGLFMIGTEVGSDVSNAALKEIYHEIEILQNEKVSLDELQTVKNYICGNFLRGIDGPFALAENFISIWKIGTDYTYFKKKLNAVLECSPEDIQRLAQKYLQKQDLIEVVAGKHQ
jgi:zinc protease